MRAVSAILAACWLGSAVPSDQDDWKVYTSKDSRFSILWPGEPAVSRSKHPRTGTIKTRFEAKAPGSAIQLLFLDVADLPPAEVKKNGFDGTMKALKDGITRGLGATVVTDEKITAGKAKHPGKDLVLHLPDMSTYIRVRAFLVGERLYAVTLVASKATVEGKLVARMFESFLPSD
jgi:hypothetical protein